MLTTSASPALGRVKIREYLEMDNLIRELRKDAWRPFPLFGPYSISQALWLAAAVIVAGVVVSFF